jgi:hypothetical protein
VFLFSLPALQNRLRCCQRIARSSAASRTPSFTFRAISERLKPGVALQPLDALPGPVMARNGAGNERMQHGNIGARCSHHIDSGIHLGADRFDLAVQLVWLGIHTPHALKRQIVNLKGLALALLREEVL